MNGRPWSDSELQFIRDNYPQKTAYWCAKQLGRDTSSVVVRTNKLFPSEKQHNNYLRKPEPCSQGLCHDCKKPAPTYRCPSCKEKHLKKHRANMDGFAADETYSVLH